MCIDLRVQRLADARTAPAGSRRLGQGSSRAWCIGMDSEARTVQHGNVRTIFFESLTLQSRSRMRSFTGMSRIQSQRAIASTTGLRWATAYAARSHAMRCLTSDEPDLIDEAINGFELAIPPSFTTSRPSSTMTDSTQSRTPAKPA